MNVPQIVIDLDELNKKWNAYLINSFFTRRFWLMITIHRKFQKELNIELTIEQMHSIRNYPNFSEYKMTLFGFLIANFPKIHAYLESTDEYDLGRRLQIYKLLLVQKKTMRRNSRFNKSDKKEITLADKQAYAEKVSHRLVREQRQRNNAWNIVK